MHIARIFTPICGRLCVCLRETYRQNRFRGKTSRQRRMNKDGKERIARPLRDAAALNRASRLASSARPLSHHAAARPLWSRASERFSTRGAPHCRCCHCASASSSPPRDVRCRRAALARVSGPRCLERKRARGCSPSFRRGPFLSAVTAPIVASFAMSAWWENVRREQRKVKKERPPLINPREDPTFGASAANAVALKHYRGDASATSRDALYRGSLA